MIALVLWGVLSAVPVGACADRAACRFRVGNDAALGEAVRALGLTVGELKAPTLKSLEGDLAFELSLDIKNSQPSENCYECRNHQHFNESKSPPLLAP